MAARLRSLRSIQGVREAAPEVSEELMERTSRLLEEARERNLLTWALVAVSGFTLGLLTGILFAPSSGYETRHRISDRASEALQSARQMARRRAEEISEEAERIA